MKAFRDNYNIKQSNLPLLFANGYPTCLDKMTEAQLEIFIPFMVQCSWGYRNMDRSEPGWWPDNIPFSIPLTKPNGMENWMEKMKKIVDICYRFYNREYMLKVSKKLASYEKTSLRFIDNHDSSITIYDRKNNKNLLSMRNEVMLYDQMERVADGQPPFDIYLCDNCDAELYSKEAALEHEKTCNVDTNNEDRELCKEFLMNFNLISKDSDNVIPTAEQTTQALTDETNEVISEKAARLVARNCPTNSLKKCPSIPISSPAGKQLLRTTKSEVSESYIKGRLDRLEQFCRTSYPSKSGGVKKQLKDRKFRCTYKKPIDSSKHVYAWPIRQFSQIRKRSRNSQFLNSELIKQCRPFSVRIKKLTEHEISSFLRGNISNETTENSNQLLSPEVLQEIIDLSSSDAEEILPD